jgi:hypothetical protein
MATLKERIDAARAKEQNSGSSLSDRIATARRIAEVKANPVISDTGGGTSGRLQKFGEGVASTGLKSYYGLKDLFGGDVSQEKRQELKGLSKSAGESGWGTAGKVAGEVAQFALPAGAALKGARAVSAGSKLLPLAAEMMATGATGAATDLPEEGESKLKSRLTRGGIEAGAALVGAGAGKLLGKAVKGVKKTKAAERYLAKYPDSYLSAGQAAEGKVIPGLESAAEVTPFLARATKRAKQKGRESFERNLFDDVSKQIDGTKLGKKGHEGVAALKAKIKAGYNKAWDADATISDEIALDMIEQIEQVLPYVPVEQTTKFNRVIKNIYKLSDDKTPEAFKNLDKSLGKATNALKGDAELLKEVDIVRQMLRDTLPAKNQAQLIKMDKAYTPYLVLQKAAASREGVKTGGDFGVNELASAVASIGKVPRTGTGGAPFQESAMLGAQTVGREVGGQPLEWFRRIAEVFPSVMPFETMNQALIGRTGLQKQALKYGNPIADALRKRGVSPATVGAAIE